MTRKARKEYNEAEAKMLAHDEAMRLQKEEAMLSDARSLTNGKAGDPKVVGQVFYSLTEELIEQGRLLRILVTSQSDYQLSENCVLAHAGRMGKIALFGTTFKAPLTTIIVGYFLMKILPSIEAALLHVK